MFFQFIVVRGEDRHGSQSRYLPSVVPNHGGEDIAGFIQGGEGEAGHREWAGDGVIIVQHLVPVDQQAFAVAELEPDEQYDKLLQPGEL